MQNGIFLFFNSSIQFEFGMLSKRKEFSFDKVVYQCFSSIFKSICCRNELKINGQTVFFLESGNYEKKKKCFHFQAKS